MKNWCPLPFGHSCIKTNGDFAVCCQHVPPIAHRMNLHRHTFEEWWHSEYLNQVRESFAADQRHPGCDKCWELEDQNFSSFRIRSQKSHALLRTTEQPQLSHLELQWGNLCNLGCLMCNEKSSSYILAENKRLKISDFSQSDYQWNQISIDNLSFVLEHRPRILDLRGGEPLYNKKIAQFLDELPSEYCAKTMLHLTSNCTTVTNQWLNIFDKFRLVRIMASVDAIGSVFEYMRFPATWLNVEKNVLDLKARSNVNIMIHAAAQNLNALHLRELIHWCQTHNIWLEYDLLLHPPHLKLTNLPKPWLGMARERLLSLDRLSLKDHLQTFVENSVELLDVALRQPDDSNEWQDFIRIIDDKDRLRGQDFRKILF